MGQIPIRVSTEHIYILGVSSCCVVGIPDSKAGEVPAAMIVLEEGSSEEEVHNLIREVLTKNLYPGAEEYVCSLPTLPSGKVDRIKVREEMRKKPSELGCLLCSVLIYILRPDHRLSYWSALAVLLLHAVPKA